MNATIDLLSAHRSIRKFTDTAVEDDLLNRILQAGQSASTSHHVQAYTIIRVKDTAKRKQIAELAGPQPWVENAPVFLMFCADMVRLQLACEINHTQPETGWTEQCIVATVDTALTAQNIMVAAESYGLGGVFIGGIRNDPETVCSLLNIPEHAFPVFGMCLGYPDQIPDIKPRLPIDLVLSEDAYPDAAEHSHIKSRLQEYDTVMNSYYSNRDSNTKDQTWTRQMADFMGKVIRPHMNAFLKKKGFFLK